MPRALLSVTDKTGLVDFARGLHDLGYELLSTGGTARALREAGLPVLDVSEVTGFPEMLDGRLKTLHPLVHGGLLGVASDPEHQAAMAEAGIEPIEVLAVNLYRFEQTVTQRHDPAQAIESIDIGGPAMIRAASKNHASVTVLVDPADYPGALQALAQNDRQAFNRGMAAKAYRHTAFYDSMIARYLSEDPFPETFTLGLRRVQTLRYGENPHQPSALYLDPLAEGGIVRAKQLWGKELSYINVFDADAAWELACDLPMRSAVIVKHGNPCGAASYDTAAESFVQARAGDPVSAYGGIIALHGEVDLEAAEAMAGKGNYFEVIVAEKFSPEAVEVFEKRSGWGQNVRLLEAMRAPAATSLNVRSVRGGVLAQISDEEPVDPNWQVVTERGPTEAEWAALRYAWTCVTHVKSNAITVADGRTLLGVGAGQMNRVQSTRLALEQAGERAKGAAIGSDAYFPFPDSIVEASKSGVSAAIQPGGSKKDPDVIAAANRLGIAMAFTGVRHFRH